MYWNFCDKTLYSVSASSYFVQTVFYDEYCWYRYLIGTLQTTAFFGIWSWITWCWNSIITPFQARQQDGTSWLGAQDYCCATVTEQCYCHQWRGHFIFSFILERQCGLQLDRPSGQIFGIGTVRYAEGLWRMRRHGPVIAHCTDSEDFPRSDPNWLRVKCGSADMRICGLNNG